MSIDTGYSQWIQERENELRQMLEANRIRHENAIKLLFLENRPLATELQQLRERTILKYLDLSVEFDKDIILNEIEIILNSYGYSIHDKELDEVIVSWIIWFLDVPFTVSKEYNFNHMN
jgi:hypothetical protein